MKRRILKRPLAERDIEECFVYIGVENIDAALAFLDAVEAALDLLSSDPLIGSIREFPDARTTGLRMWTIRGYERYEIFYLTTNDAIDIVRVLHSARDIDTIFRN